MTWTMTFPSEAQIDAIADAIINKMRRPIIPLEAEYWSLREIAASYKVSVEHARRISAIKGFPSPVRLPSDGTSGHPRWKATEVIEWFDEYRVA